MARSAQKKLSPKPKPVDPDRIRGTPVWAKQPLLYSALQQKLHREATGKLLFRELKRQGIRTANLRAKLLGVPAETPFSKTNIALLADIDLSAAGIDPARLTSAFKQAVDAKDMEDCLKLLYRNHLALARITVHEPRHGGEVYDAFLQAIIRTASLPVLRELWLSLHAHGVPATHENLAAAVKVANSLDADEAAKIASLGGCYVTPALSLEELLSS